MKDVYLSLIFPHPLRSSKMDFYSSSSFQITAHISSFPSKPESTTLGSILSMIQVVSDHNLFMKVKETSKLSTTTNNYSIAFLELYIQCLKWTHSIDEILLWVCRNNIVLHVMFIMQIFMSVTFFLSFSCWLLLMARSFSLHSVSMMSSSL